MELTDFIRGLVTEGNVTVQGALTSFAAEDTEQTKELLQKYYEEDALEMPFEAPAFSAEASLWAAQYFYQAVQLAILRDAEKEIIEQHLLPFPGNITPESIYSADLILRYLSALFDLAKGLAPADILVEKLRETARTWPFSSVGVDLGEEVDDNIIFLHPSLQQAYTDRIIEQKDKKRLTGLKARTQLLETTGNYLSFFWPEIETELNPATNEISPGKTI